MKRIRSEQALDRFEGQPQPFAFAGIKWILVLKINNPISIRNLYV